MARSRAMARVNWVSQGQCWGRCRVRRRAERVIRPTRAKTRRLRVLVVTVRSARPMRAVQRARLCAITCTASQAPLAAKRPEGRWLSPTPCFRSRMSTLASASFCVSGLPPLSPGVARALTEDSGIPLPSVYWLFSPPELVLRGHYHRSLAGVEILPAHVGAQHEIHNVCVVVQVAHWGLDAQLLTREMAVAPVDRGPAPVLVQTARNN